MFLSLQNVRVGHIFKPYSSQILLKTFKSSKVDVIRDPLAIYQLILSESLSICIGIEVIDVV